MNKVNPMALMLSGVMMLRHLREHEAADRMESAIAAVIKEGKSVTYDMKPSRDDPTAVGTSDVADAVIEKMRRRPRSDARLIESRVTRRETRRRGAGSCAPSAVRR